MSELDTKSLSKETVSDSAFIIFGLTVALIGWLCFKLDIAEKRVDMYSASLESPIKYCKERYNANAELTNETINLRLENHQGIIVVPVYKCKVGE